MTQPLTDSSRLSGFNRAMHDHWVIFLVEGIILILLGLAAVVVPLIAGLTLTIFLGWLFLIAGVVSLIATFQARRAPGFGWSLFSALAALIAGAVLLWRPVEGLISLTFVLIAFFIVDGIFNIVLAIAHRRELSGRWEWILLSGLIDLILAAIVIAGLPQTLAWALGLLVGIDLVFGGCALAVMALTARANPDAI